MFPVNFTPKRNAHFGFGQDSGNPLKTILCTKYCVKGLHVVINRIQLLQSSVRFRLKKNHPIFIFFSICCYLNFIPTIIILTNKCRKPMIKVTLSKSTVVTMRRHLVIINRKELNSCVLLHQFTTIPFAVSIYQH